VTPAQREEIDRIERDVKTSIGEWETPEERLEHAPRARRRRPEERSVETSREAEPAAASNGDAAKVSTDAEPAGEADGDRDSKSETVKLFVNRGERSGIDEEDLRWALREGAVLPDEAIHDVRVLHRFSFVEVDPKEAERTVEFLDGTKLKGKEIRLEVARS